MAALAPGVLAEDLRALVRHGQVDPPTRDALIQAAELIDTIERAQPVLDAANRFCDRWISQDQPALHPGLRALVAAVREWRGAR